VRGDLGDWRWCAVVSGGGGLRCSRRRLGRLRRLLVRARSRVRLGRGCNGENEGVDWAHANDDGGMADRRVAQADGEAELVDGDADEGEIEEVPVVVESAFLFVSGERFGKHGHTAADGIEEEDENAGEDETEGSKGESGHVAESDFAD